MNEHTKQRLFNYSETPPPSVWNGIAETLDTPAYAQKLYDFETAPPANLWIKIDKQLAKPVAAVVPLRGKLFKTAIAAVFIALAVGGYFYFKAESGSNLAGRNQQNSSARDKNTLAGTQPAGAKAETTQAIKPFTDSDTNTEETAMASNGRVVHFSPRVRIANNDFDENLAAITPEEKTIIDPNLADRYMIATTATGKAVRLPKKAYSDYACAEALQNYQCKEKMAALQSKMAASVATDFTDFIDLLKKLQEAQ